MSIAIVGSRCVVGLLPRFGCVVVVVEYVWCVSMVFELVVGVGCKCGHSGWC